MGEETGVWKEKKMGTTVEDALESRMQYRQDLCVRAVV